MNIFFLSICIRRCARYHFDKHVVKMILEYAQLLSIAYHILNPKEAIKLEKENKIYRKTFINHPCAIWVRSHINNYNYVAKLGLALCDEWRFRYNHPNSRKHAAEEKLYFLLNNPPKNIAKNSINLTKKNPKGFTLPMFQCMPEECKNNEKTVLGCIKAYRKYYMSTYKEKLWSWTKSGDKKRKNINKPHWWKNK
jgi:Pyrimidine dimer DNA glycosylase